MSHLAFILSLCIMFNGFALCASETNNSRDISADQIIFDLSKDEPVNYNHVRVIGDLDLNKPELISGYKINAPIKITNSIVLGSINFNNTKLLKDIDFENTEFKRSVRFFNSEFMGDVSFKSTKFNDSALFWRAKFNSMADFSGAHFAGEANFRNVDFRFGPIYFIGSRFDGHTRFWGARFDSETIDFGWSKFNDELSFWGSNFIGNAEFEGVQFNGTTDFTLAHFNKTFDLLGARFEKELIFTDVEFSDLKVSWDSFKDKLNCNGPMYLMLIKNFKELEQFEDADNCYYQYRDWKRNDRDPGWPKFFDYLAWLSCGYGVRWHYTIISGILMIAVFGIYFESSYLLRSIVSVFLKKDIQSQGPSISNIWMSMKKSISFSAMILLSLPSDWFPYGKEEYSKLVRSHLCAAILERLIGWGLMLLLIGTLTRLMVRY